ncbi:MAG: glycosyl hydrolase, partial [Bacteroidales bacterium]|nr:glycosyl hydrolase [Bacteroidales bacterium]
MKKFLSIALLTLVCSMTFAQKSWDLKNFPEGSQPEEIGKKLVEHYLDTPHSHWGDINSKYEVKLVTYPDVCAWLGSL